MLKKITALLVFMLLFTIAVPVTQARTSEQLYNDIQRLNEQINILETSGNYSNDEVSSILVDFSSVSTSGSISMAVYESVYQTSTTSDFTIAPLPWNQAEQQLVKYTLGNIANLYKAEPYNTDITCKTYQAGFIPRTIIPIYIRGQYKAEAAAELFNGIPNCFEIDYYPPGSNDSSGYSGSSSVPTKPISTPVADTLKDKPVSEGSVASVLKAVFVVDGTTNVLKLSGTEEQGTHEIIMDVEPYIKNDRTYVPVRHLSYALGVSENGISWDSKTQKVGIAKADTNITLTIGSKTMLVNKEIVLMDVPPEIAEGRTMLPARWVAEALGAEVEWDGNTGEVVIFLEQDRDS